MESLSSLLQQRKPEEPPEIVAIKHYVTEKFGVSPKVSLQTNAIIISVESASLAGMLRMHLHPMAAAAQTDNGLSCVLASKHSAHSQ